jgi:predicted ATPase
VVGAPAIGGGPAATGLPERQTSFLGRDRELDELAGLVGANRLVTLTGAGGSGKTSLAVELARREAGRFDDGTWFVALDSIASADLVPGALAAAFGLLPSAGASIEGQVEAFLADRSALVVLDNVEHLLAAAPFVARLIDAAPRVTIVATSRAPLRLSREQEFQVSPLGLPAPGVPPAEAAASPAVRLFVERARRVRPAFELDDRSVDAASEICRRVDGLPLGIELAAARVGRMPLRSIADRLAERLDLPGRAAADVPRRQRTLTEAIGWSYDLLDPGTQALLARLSVFAGGFTMDAAELVCQAADDETSVVDRVFELSEHSLVETVEALEIARLRLLETVRAFAAERLAERGETDELRRRHALYFRELSETAAEYLPGREQQGWLDRLAIEHANLRAAIEWAIEADHAETALRLGAALWRFWELRGRLHEGLATIDRILGIPGADQPSVHRVRALDAAGSLYWWASDVARADAFYSTALELARGIGDLKGAADALVNLHWARFAVGADGQELDRLRDQAIRLYEEIGDRRAIPRARMTNGYAMLRAGRSDDAERLMLDLYRDFGTTDDPYYAGLTAQVLAAIALGRGHLTEALDWTARVLRGWLAMGDLALTVNEIRSGAVLLFAAGEADAAAALNGAFEALCRRHGLRPAIYLEDMVPTGLTHAEVAAGLTAPSYADAARRGAAMSMGEAAEYFIAIVEGEGSPDTATPQVATAAHGTRFVREGDVWQIDFEGRTIRLKDTKGLRYLARLVAAPGREIAAIDLAADGIAGGATSMGGAATDALSVVGGSTEDVLDATARAAYKARLLELQQEIDEAERVDPDRAGLLQEEFDAIVGELTAATGLGGRDRGAATPAERARQSVTKAIRSSMDRIASEHPSLGAHFEHSVRTGVMCTYSPDERAAPAWVTT